MVAAMLFLGCDQVTAQQTDASKSIAAVKVIPRAKIGRIPAGTQLFNPKKSDYSNVVLFVKGRLAAGDVEAVSDTAKYYADLFNLAYAVNVKQVGAEYVLDKVGVGFSSRINGQDVVVSTDTAESLGLKLSLIGRSVLSGNERALDDINVVGKSSLTAVVDAPAVMNFRGRHQKMVARFFIWASRTDGRVGTTVWLLNKSERGLEFAEDEINYLPPGMVEDRIMHVDKSKFILGLPTEEAFAMESLPKGRAFKISGPLQKVGALENYSETSLQELATALAELMNKK